MTKKVFRLVFIASVLSAALLFVGTTVMGKFSPVLASSLNALVSNTGNETSTGSNQPINQDAGLITAGARQAEEKVSARNAEVAAVTLSSIRLESTSTATTLQASSVTIAALLKDPAQYRDQLVSVSGIVSLLSDEKLLLNDGTGQILVELESGHLSGAPAEGQTLTILGRFDPSNDDSSFKIEAYAVLDANGVLLAGSLLDHEDSYVEDSGDGAEDSYDDGADDSSDDHSSLEDSSDDSHDSVDDNGAEDSSDDSHNDSHDAGAEDSHDDSHDD